MRKRMIDPDIWEDEKIIQLDLLGKIIFIGIITTADDEGRLRGHPKIIKAKILPADNIDEKEIEKRLNQLHELKLIQLYKHNNERYIQITNWYKHQTLRKDRSKPSIYPPPDNHLTTKRQPNVNQMSTKCQPNVNQLTAISKDKLSKDKISKDKINNIYVAQTDFEKSVLSCLQNLKIITIPLTHLQKILPIWEKTYADQFDVVKEINKAESWLIANKRRKKNYAKFLNNWFNKVLDKQLGGKKDVSSQHLKPETGKYDKFEKRH